MLRTLSYRNIIHSHPHIHVLHFQIGKRAEEFPSLVQRISRFQQLGTIRVVVLLRSKFETLVFITRVGQGFLGFVTLFLLSGGLLSFFLRLLLSIAQMVWLSIETLK